MKSLSMLRASRSGTATTNPRQPAAISATFNPIVPARVIIVTGAIALPRNPENVWIAKARAKAEPEKGSPGETEAEHQHPARSDPIHQIADRQLRGDPDDAGDGQRQAELDKADAERHGQQWKQRRQNQALEMIGEVRGRRHRQRLVPPGLAPLAALYRQRLRRHPHRLPLFLSSGATWRADATS